MALSSIAEGGPAGIAGGPFGSALGRKDYTEAGVPVIRGAQLSTSRRFSHDDLVFVTEAKADRHRRNLAHPGDLVVTQRGTLGQVGLIPVDAPYPRYLLSQSQMKITVDRGLADPEFLFYALRARDTTARLTDHALIAGVPHINLGILRDFTVAVPPVTLQRRIAAALRAFDELIAINERCTELLEGLARSLYREWFVRLRFPGHPATKGATAGLPDGWSTVSLGEVSENLDRYRRPLSKPQREARRGTFPYYGAAKLIDFIDGWLFDGEYLLFAEDGTVQTPSGFPVLQLVEGQFWANNHTHVLRGTAVSTRYLYLAVGRYPIAGHVTGAAQPKITQSNLRRVPVTRAADAVHASFDQVIDPLFETICASRKAVSALARTRDLLLPRLVTGRLDISDIDLGDLLPAELAA